MRRVPCGNVVDHGIGHENHGVAGTCQRQRIRGHSVCVYVDESLTMGVVWTLDPYKLTVHLIS